MKSLKKFFINVVMIFLGITIILFVVTALVSFIDSGAEFGARVVKGCFFLVLSCVFAVPLVVLWDQSRPSSPDHKDNVIVKFAKELWELIFPKSKPKKTPAELQWERARQMQIVENQKRARMQRESVNYSQQTQLQYYPIQRNGQKVKRLLATDLTGFNCRNLTKATSLKSIRTFIAFDTETTGLGVAWNDIIELSAIKFVDFRPQAVFTTFLKPRKPIPPDATAINHITDAMVANAPYFYEILPSFEAFVGDSPMVAHNAPFDVRHLYASGMESIANKVVFDTCSISRKMDIGIPNHKLGTACIARNIRNDNAHRAASDAMACGMLFVQYVLEKKECSSIEDLLRQM